MADTEAARAAGEAAIGDQRHLLADAQAIERGRRRQHFAHAWPALGTFVADDDHIALLELALHHGVERCLLRIEAARRAAEDQALHAGHLHDGTIGREIAFEADHATGRRDAVLHAIDDILVR